MATFTMDDQDVEGFVQRDQGELLKEEGPWPATAFAVAVVLFWMSPLFSAVSFGMALAWSYSLWKRHRFIRTWYRVDNEVMRGPVTMEVREDAVWAKWALGENSFRWDELSSVKNYPDFFVLEATGQEVLIMPKRHFSEDELISVHSKANEVNARGESEGPDNNGLKPTRRG